MGATDRNDLFLLACISGAGTVIGSIGPWESGFNSSEAGTAGAGLYTVFLGGLSTVLLLASSFGRRRDACIITTLFGGLIFGIALYRLIDLSSQSGPLGTDPIDPGWGVWLTVGAGAVLAICSLLLVQGSESRVPDES